MVEEKYTAKQRIILRWRKEKNLCFHCGLDKHEGVCKVNFSKVDLRQNNLSPAKLTTDFNKKKNTVLHYRRKKNLCISCGLDKHQGICIETFEKSDMRSQQQKEIDPRTILTPKKDKIQIEVEEVDKSLVDLVKQNDPIYNRQYVLLDLTDSNKGYRIEFSTLRYLSITFKDLILLCYGTFDSHFNVEDVWKIKKLVNVHEIKVVTDQGMVDLIWKCNRFFSYKSKFTIYALHHNIPIYLFDSDKNIKSIDICVNRIK